MKPGYDGSIKIDTSIDSKGFNAGIDGLIGSVTQFGFVVTAAVGAAVVAIGALGAASVTTASHVEEMGSKFDTVFGKFSANVKKQLAELADATNRSANEMMEWASGVQDTLVPLGLARGKAADLSVEVVKLANDLGSFNDLPTAEVMRDIKSALIGEYEPVRKYGAILNEATVSQEALNMGLWDGTGAITAQAKALAAISLIQKSNSDAMGDAARTSNSYANQIRGLEAAFGDFKVAFGQAIIPVLLQIIPLVKEALKWLTAMMTQVAQFMQVLFGLNKDTGAGAKNLQNAADSAAELADNIKNVDKEAKKSLASFDKIDTLSNNTSENAGIDTGTIALPVLDTTPVTTPLDETLAKIEAFKNEFLKFIQPAIDAFNRLVTALKPLGVTIWAGLKWGWDNIIVPFSKWVITDLLPVWFDMLAAAIELLNTVLIALQPFGLWLWDNFLKPIAEWTGAAFIIYLQGITDTFKILTALLKGDFKGAWELIQEVVNRNGTFMVETWTKVSDWFKNNFIPAVIWVFETLFTNIGTILTFALKLIKGMWDKVALWFDTTVIKPIQMFFAQLWASVGIYATTAFANLIAKWLPLKVWFDSNVVTPLKTMFDSAFKFFGIVAHNAWLVVSLAWSVVSNWFTVNVINPLKLSFTSLYNDMQAKAQNAWVFVSNVWKTATGWFDTNVINPLKAKFASAWNQIQADASNSIGKIGDIFNQVKTWVDSKITNPLKSSFTSALNGVEDQWRDTFNGIYSFIKGIINDMIDLMNQMFNGFAGGFNGIIDTLNATGQQLPGWQSIPYVSAPQIPFLASGAVIPPNSQFLAVLGDQRRGNNIETPEGLLRQIISESLGNIQANVDIGFKGTLSAFWREMQPYVEKNEVRIGASLVKGNAKI